MDFWPKTTEQPAEGKKMVFTPFKPLELDMYLHRYDYFLNPMVTPTPVDQNAADTISNEEVSGSCSCSESDFKSIEKNIENEILNQSFEESVP